jgi:hypothetical protein
VYDQGGVPQTTAAVFQFTHDAVPMIFCGVMVWQMHTIGIVVRVVRFANHEIIAGAVSLNSSGKPF